MSRLIIISSLLVLIISTTACVPTANTKEEAANPYGPPAWVLNPRLAGNIVGLGSAKQHMNGFSAQRQLAISRALDEIARQQGVEVSSILVTEGRSSGFGTSSKLNTASEQKVSGASVNARIAEEWNSGSELYVLMVAD